MTISMIVCITQDMVIGVNNGLLINDFKPDMAYFKKTTMNHFVVMGKNTYLTLPHHKPLKDRDNIIISSTLAENPPEDFIVYKSIQDFFEYQKDNESEIFVIGGSKLYDAFMPYTNKIYLTVVKRESESLLKDIDGFNKKVIKFPSSVYDYEWSYNHIKDDFYLSKNFGILPYSILTLKRSF